MDRDIYAIALTNVLNEVRTVYPEINASFIFTKDHLIVAADESAAEATMDSTLQAFRNLQERADTTGGLTTLLITGKSGKLIISSVGNLYVATAASARADATYLQAVPRIVVPTILKLLENIAAPPLETMATTPLESPAPTPLGSPPSLQLIVDTLSGFFVGSSVELDPHVLNQWSELMNQDKIEQVEIEVFGGKRTQCKAKEIGEQKLKGKGIIRIPEKTCKALKVKKGELVKVTPVTG